VVYTQIENHALNPIIMSRTVRISPLLVLLSVLVGASIGAWVGGIFGGFVAALLSIPAAGALQVIVIEIWRLTGPPGTTVTMETVETDGTVVPAGEAGTSDSVEVMVDKPDLDGDRDRDRDSAASADGRHQRP
jgi:hypothetical protein